jgi:hypothetical protein
VVWPIIAQPTAESARRNSSSDSPVRKAGGLLWRHPANEDRHEQCRCLIVGKAAIGDAGNEKIDSGAIERTAITLIPYEIDCAH